VELQLVTATTGDPITVAEAKAHLRVTHSEDDSLIGALVSAATKQVEAETGRQLCTAVYDLKLDAFPTGCDKRERAIKFPRAPLQSVSSGQYTADDGTATALSSTAYTVVTSWTTAPDPFCGHGRMYEAYNDTWPTTRQVGNAVTIRFTAGYGPASAVPDIAKAAIKLLVGNLYEHREATISGGLSEVPLGAQRLIDLLKLGEL
jgi:uncharacterized phiE125 gp8 family phage protein